MADARVIAFPTPERTALQRLAGPHIGFDEWTIAMTLYAESQTAAGFAAGTVRLHRHYLTGLARAFRSPLDVSALDLQGWLGRQQWSPETRKSARGAVRRFYDWMVGAGIMDVSPAERLASVRVPRGVAKPIPDKVLFAAMARVRDPRVTLMMLLARYAGLRCCEIATLRYEHYIDGVLYVTGKGGHTRVVPVVLPELMEALAMERGGFIFRSFSSRGGAHLTAAAVSDMIAAALPGAWTAHKLRHAYATSSYAANADALALGRVLGHAKPETTLRYVEVDQAALKRVSEGATRGHRPPRARSRK